MDAVYRPFDIRHLYYSPTFVSRYGPDLGRAWGDNNLCLYALPSGTGAGPAVWCHALLPDYHAFSGRGGYAFPLWDRRRGPDVHNFSPSLLDRLAEHYARPVPPGHAFDAILGLLSATSYTSRFAWDLEETFAHIPFPADPAVFAEAARIGAEIRLLETFGREPDAAFRSAKLLGRPSGLPLAKIRPADFSEDDTGGGHVPLLADQSLRVAGVSRRAWEFSVSGYRVLQKWLAAREGQIVDAALQRQILDLFWHVDELLNWFDAADPVLAAAVAHPLTCAELGIPNPGPTRRPPLDFGDDADGIAVG